MPQVLLLSSPDYSTTVELLRHVSHTAWLYLAAAVVARFWHKYLWVIYLALAIAALAVSH
jgi:hypothetical protein